MSESGQPGQQTGIAFVLVLSIVTLGIYYLYWTWSGFFILIPPWPVASLIWLARVQGKLNDFWAAQASAQLEAVTTASTPVQAAVAV